MPAEQSARPPGGAPRSTSDMQHGSGTPQRVPLPCLFAIWSIPESMRLCIAGNAHFFRFRKGDAPQRTKRKGAGKIPAPFQRVKKPFLTRWQTAKMFGRKATCTRRRTRVRGRLRAPPVADAASKKEWQRSKFEAAVSAAHKFWEPQQEGRKLRSTRKGYAASVARQNPCVASKKRLNFVSLRGRIAAVAILKL